MEDPPAEAFSGKQADGGSRRSLSDSLSPRRAATKLKGEVASRGDCVSFVATEIVPFMDVTTDLITIFTNRSMHLLYRTGCVMFVLHLVARAVGAARRKDDSDHASAHPVLFPNRRLWTTCVFLPTTCIAVAVGALLVPVYCTVYAFTFLCDVIASLGAYAVTGECNMRPMYTIFSRCFHDIFPGVIGHLLQLDPRLGGMNKSMWTTIVVALSGQRALMSAGKYDFKKRGYEFGQVIFELFLENIAGVCIAASIMTGTEEAAPYVPWYLAGRTWSLISLVFAAISVCLEFGVQYGHSVQFVRNAALREDVSDHECVVEANLVIDI